MSSVSPCAFGRRYFLVQWFFIVPKMCCVSWLLGFCLYTVVCFTCLVLLYCSPITVHESSLPFVTWFYSFILVRVVLFTHPLRAVEYTPSPPLWSSPYALCGEVFSRDNLEKPHSKYLKLGYGSEMTIPRDKVKYCDRTRPPNIWVELEDWTIATRDPKANTRVFSLPNTPLYIRAYFAMFFIVYSDCQDNDLSRKLTRNL